MRRTAADLLSLLALAALTASAQTGNRDLDSACAVFFECNIVESLPLFEHLVQKNPENAEVLTWLAEAHRRMGSKDAAVAEARKALALDPCLAFAHLVLAQASYPDMDTISVHVRKAIACDSTDPNAWLMMWGEAMRDGDFSLRTRCLRKLVETGFFTPAALAYGRAELRTLPKGAILFTNGDMDTYPAQAVQVTEGFRPDIAVVEREHLGFRWGCRFIRDFQEVNLPFPESRVDVMKDSVDVRGTTFSVADQVFRELLDMTSRGKQNRPIAVAPTVDSSFFMWGKEHFIYRGMYFLWQPEEGNTPADTAALRACIEGIDPASFSGPWASAKDRSPIRRRYTNQIAGVISDVVLVYSEALIKANRFTEAGRILQWLELYERGTEMGDVSAEKISTLRKSLRDE